MSGEANAGVFTMAMCRALVLWCVPCLAVGLRANASRVVASGPPSPFMLVSGVSSPDELCLVAGANASCTRVVAGAPRRVSVWQGRRALTGRVWAWRHAQLCLLPVMGEIFGDSRAMGSCSM